MEAITTTSEIDALPGEHRDENVLKDVILGVLSQYRELSIRGLHMIVFYIDYRYYQEHGEKLTDAYYRPAMGGFYAGDITHITNKFDLRSGTIDAGEDLRLPEYYYSGETNPEIMDIITPLLDEVQSVHFDDVMDFNMNTGLQHQTDSDGMVIFNDETVENPNTQ